jgi:hypothetical protein
MVVWGLQACLRTWHIHFRPLRPLLTSVGVASTSRVPAIVGTGTCIYDPLASVIYRLNALEEGVDSFHRETKMCVGELRAMCDELRKGGRF